jgi:hypothetical protein
MGGKFTRYFTMALPVVLITAAIGIHFVAHWVARHIPNLANDDSARALVRACIVSVVLIFPLVASASVSPYYRLYTNVLGGGNERAGSYFPHDEFYDARVREVVSEIAAQARPHARVASEAPGLISYYGQLAGRNDLIPFSLSDKEAMKQFEAGDFIIVARGRRYFSNEAYVTRLVETSEPAASISLGGIPAIRLYVLNDISLAAVAETLK